MKPALLMLPVRASLAIRYWIASRIVTLVSLPPIGIVILRPRISFQIVASFLRPLGRPRLLPLCPGLQVYSGGGLPLPIA